MSTDNNGKNVISKENENITTSPHPSPPKIDNININANDEKNLNELNDNKNANISSKENNITKSFNDIHRKTIRNYTNNSYFNNIKNIFTQSDYYPNDTKKSTYYNLSKLNYKDGVILKDAANSNPGYGLWSIKLSDENKFLKKVKEEEDHSNESYNSNIYSNRLFNNVNNIKLKDNSLSDIDIGIGNDGSIDNSNLYEDEVDQIIIKKLTKRSNILEKRYKKVLNKFYEKDNLCMNLEKLKKEYELLVNESIQEKNEMRNRCEKLDNNNQALINSLSNIRKEIERLIGVIKEDQIKMREKIEEYNKQLVEEENKRKKIISRIKFTESQIYILQDKIEQDKNENNFDLNNNNDNITEGTTTSREFNKTNNKITKNKFGKIDKSKLLFDEQTKKFYKVKKESKKEKDVKINRKKEYIKQLQEELERLKIEDKEKMNERRELFGLIKDKNNNEKEYKKYMEKMFDILDKQEKEHKWNSDSIPIKNKNNIIFNLKRISNSK